MEEIHLAIFLTVVFLPLLINGLLDAFTGLLYRPLTDLSFLLAILGTCWLCWQSGDVFLKVLTASLTAILILLMLWLIYFVLSQQGANIYLGRGDYRLIALTSYLCALENPILSFFSLWLSGVFMLSIFSVVTVKRLFQLKIAKSRKRSEISTQLNQQNSPKTDRDLLYSARKAPMGLAIISAAALTVFGSIAQT